MENKTVMYQLVDPSQMMSYVIKTKEGKLIVIDGGYDRNAVDIIAKAKELSGADVPVIDAWIHTHCHDDHCVAFAEIVLKMPEALDIKHVYHNFLKYEIIKWAQEKFFLPVWTVTEPRRDMISNLLD